MASFSRILVIYYPKHLDENKLKENKENLLSSSEKLQVYFCFLKILLNIFFGNIIEKIQIEENYHPQKRFILYTLFLLTGCFQSTIYCEEDFQLRRQIKLQKAMVTRSKFPFVSSHWESPKGQDRGTRFCGSWGQRQGWKERYWFKVCIRLQKRNRTRSVTAGPRNFRFSTALASSNSSKFLFSSSYKHPVTSTSGKGMLMSCIYWRPQSPSRFWDGHLFCDLSSVMVSRKSVCPAFFLVVRMGLRLF